MALLSNTTVYGTLSGSGIIYDLTSNSLIWASGYSLASGINTQTGNYATAANLATTGTTLNNKINSLSGYVTGADATFATITNLTSTGSTLDTKINNLSGYVTGITGIFGSLPTNLASTGSTLDNKINSLSGYVTGITGTFGASVNSLNNYAVFITGNQIISGNKSFISPITSPNLVYTSGDQIISGNKIFTGDVDIQGIATIQNLNLLMTDYYFDGVNIQIINSSVRVSGDIYISGNKVLTGTNLGLTGSTLDTKINNLSGYVTGTNSTFTTNLFSTGSTLDTKINTLSGYVTGSNVTLTTNLTSTGSNLNNSIISLSGLFTGFTGALDATFATDLQLYTTGSTLDNKINSLSGNLTSTYVTKSNGLFTNRPTVNGTGVLLSGDIPYVQTNSYFYVDATRTDSYVENGNILYPYKTLSGAYNAAKNIAYFHNPTYITLLSPIAENLTIDKGYINLIGNNTNKNDPIRITGSLVFAATGIGTTATDNNFSIAGLGVTATSNNKCILFSGNNPQRLFIQDCWLIAKDNGTCLYSNNTNTTSRLQGDILKLSPEGVNTTAIDIVSGISSISFAETSSSASVLAYVRNNSTLNISNSQIETAGEKAFQVENTARLTLLNSALTNTANPSTGIFLKDAFSTAVVVGSVISVPANANSYAINGAAYSYLFYKNLYFSIDAIGGSTESKIGNNVNKNLINSYDPVVYSIGNQTISGVKTFDVFPVVSGNKLITGVDLSSYATTANLASTGSTLVTNLASTGSTLNTRINNLSGYINSTSSNIVFTTGNQTISGVKSFAQDTTFGDSAQGDFLVISGNNFTVYGSGNFTSGLFVNSNAVLTGVNLSSYATTANLVSTGSTLDTKINNLSGYVTGANATFASITNLASTGSTLTSRINSLSGTLTGNYATILNLASTGSTLNTRINSLSGILTGNYLTTSSASSTYATITNLGSTGSTLQTNINNLSNTYATITNLANTGSTLVNSIASLSGTLTSNYSTITNLSTTGSTLDTKINNLSGVSILRFGDQTISGLKTFTNTGTFTSGIDLNNSNLINATPQIINLSANFNISGNYNSRMIMVNSANEVTGRIVSGNALGFNTTITQVGAGKIFITGSGIGINIGSYNNQYRTAGQFATASLLHTGNNGYMMYGNTAS
jgi:hypothetical protein